jgi:hypothetical protein
MVLTTGKKKQGRREQKAKNGAMKSGVVHEREDFLR